MRRILVELMSARTYVKTLFEKPWLRFNEAEMLIIYYRRIVVSLSHTTKSLSRNSAGRGTKQKANALSHHPKLVILNLFTWHFNRKDNVFQSSSDRNAGRFNVGGNIHRDAVRKCIPAV